MSLIFGGLFAMKKKLLFFSIILFASIILSVFFASCDGDTVHTKGLEYKLNNDKNSYSVSSIGTATDTDINIPEEYNGKPVTGIAGSAFAGGGQQNN